MSLFIRDSVYVVFFSLFSNFQLFKTFKFIYLKICVDANENTCVYVKMIFAKLELKLLMRKKRSHYLTCSNQKLKYIL